MRIPAGTVDATRLDHAWLVLNDAGDLGVMTVAGTSPTVARFATVEPLADVASGIWVQGLDANTRLVTLGQTALKDGAAIRAVEATP